jgi:glucose-1-phosphate adenylyltransferase
VDRGILDHAILRGSVLVERGARLEHCIVLERSRVGRGARVRRAIIDEDNHLPAGECIGFDLARDRLRFPVTENGVVVIPAGTFAPPGARRPTGTPIPPPSVPNGCVSVVHPGTACGSAMAASHASSFT